MCHRLSPAPGAIVLLGSALAIASESRQVALRQATTIAAIGLGIFLATSAASLHYTNQLKQSNIIETELTRKTAATFAEVFKGDPNANIPPDPNVKETK